MLWFICVLSLHIYRKECWGHTVIYVVFPSQVKCAKWLVLIQSQRSLLLPSHGGNDIQYIESNINLWCLLLHHKRGKGKCTEQRTSVWRCSSLCLRAKSMSSGAAPHSGSAGNFPRGFKNTKLSSVFRINYSNERDREAWCFLFPQCCWGWLAYETNVKVPDSFPGLLRWTHNQPQFAAASSHLLITLSKTGG